MRPPHPPLPRAPSPTKVFFDPFNSSSTGHQRAANRLSGSTSWRDSRSYKLSHQYRDTSGRGGSEYLAGLVGPGSEDFARDSRKENGDGEEGAPGLREEGWQDIRGMMGPRRGLKRKSEDGEEAAGVVGNENGGMTADEKTAEAPRLPSSTPDQPKPQIFRSLNVYLNGSTAPLISDLKLKHLFAQHGGTTSLALGRRTVTHVIIGDSCGGGLASTKIEKEVRTIRGKGIKFVTVQWVLDSIERGVRQPEGRYRPRNLVGRLGGTGQGSVGEIFGRKT